MAVHTACLAISAAFGSGMNLGFAKVKQPCLTFFCGALMAIKGSG